MDAWKRLPADRCDHGVAANDRCVDCVVEGWKLSWLNGERQLDEYELRVLRYVSDEWLAALDRYELFQLPRRTLIFSGVPGRFERVRVRGETVCETPRSGRCAKSS